MSIRAALLTVATLALGASAAHAATPRVVSVPKSQAPKAADRPAGTKVSCNKPGSYPTDTCPVIKLGDTAFWAFSYTNNSYGFELAAYRGGRLLGSTRVGGTRYLEGARVNRRAHTVELIGQGGRKASVDYAQLERLAGAQPSARPEPQPRPRARDDARAPGRHCAREGGRCRFRGEGVVHYGARGRYAKRRARDGIDCNNGTFGDPIRGVVKDCFVTVTGPAPRTRARRPDRAHTRRAKVSLRSHHGKWVVAEGDGKANANRGRVGEWEIFTMITHPDGKVSFLGHHGKYLVAEADGSVNANRSHAREWEKWTMINHRDGTVSFRSHHGKYLVAEGDGRLNANRPHMKEWERFRLVRR